MGQDEFCYKDMETLCVDLPEDILKKKWYGDFDGAIRLIEERVKRDIPEMLRHRLLLEREILRALPVEYIYDREQALAVLQEKVPDFTEEEFRELQDKGKIDWIYVKGKERYHNDFADTLLVANKEIRKRAAVLDPSLNEISREKAALFQAIQELREQKHLDWYTRIRASVKISEDAFRKGHVKVHIPMPCFCQQVQQIRILNTSSPDYILADESAPQRTICFEEDMEENHEFFVEYEYRNSVHYVEVDQEQVQPIDEELFAADLCEKLPHIRFTPYLRALAAELTAGIRSPYAKAQRIYDYITTHIEYSYVRNYLSIENLPEYAALGGRGDCGIQALLFITLCRIAGVPARWQSGLYSTPYSAGFHDWAQFYVEPYGWLFADCSFGGSANRDGDEARRQFYFGNLDPFRMPANSAFQEEFIPRKNFLRVDPYDNQGGEVEYADRGLRIGEFESTRTVMESHREVKK